MPAVSRRPVSRTGSAGLRASAVSTSGSEGAQRLSRTAGHRAADKAHDPHERSEREQARARPRAYPPDARPAPPRRRAAGPPGRPAPPRDLGRRYLSGVQTSKISVGWPPEVPAGGGGMVAELSGS